MRGYEALSEPHKNDIHHCGFTETVAVEIPPRNLPHGRRAQLTVYEVLIEEHRYGLRVSGLGVMNPEILAATDQRPLSG